jgi:hypothetical protein
VKREVRKDTVVRLIEPVSEAHQGDFLSGVGHQTVAARFVAGKLLAVEEQNGEA